MWRTLLVAAVVAGAACSYTPTTIDDTRPSLSQSTKVYAADGSLLTTLRAEQNREDVRVSELADHVVDAVLAVEDSRFYDHDGVDVRAILRATAANSRSGRIVEGGSTITQQYVKNTYLTPEQSFERKAEEALLAVQLERSSSKDRILELYVNTIYFGNGAYGIQAAADAYFGVDATELTVAQAATLAALIRAPSAFDPFDEPEAATGRRDAALVRMGELGWLTPDEVVAASAEPLVLVARADVDRYEAPWFVERAKRFVLTDERFGATFGERRDLLFHGGLRITTTVDPRLQALAEEAVAEIRPDEPGPEAALISLDPATGYVRALVGGRDFFGGGGEARVDLATGGQGRPAGSAFKPLVLAAAREEGIPLHRRYPAPAQLDINLPDELWRVRNYEGSEVLGQADLVEATINSSNTVYAQLIQDVGAREAMAAATRYGVRSPLAANPSAVLGTNLVTGLDMAAAYATFANRGVRVDPAFVTSVTRRDGTILYRHDHHQERVLDPRVADEINAVLERVVNEGTGVRARIGRPVAGKTGTGQQWRDAWFVGYTPELVTSVWMGFAREGSRSMVPPATPFRVTGGSWPAQIWQRYSEAALADLPVRPFTPPGEPPPPTTVPTTVPPPAQWVPRVRDVVGLRVGTATHSLSRDGYVVARADVPSDEYPPGYVVGQRPSAGSRVAGGARVVLQVADGRAATNVVPDLLGVTGDVAEQVANAAGFHLEVVTDTEPAAGGSQVAGGRRSGLTWRQVPPAGTRAPIATAVEVSVNPGEAPTVPTTSTEPPPSARDD